MRAWTTALALVAVPVLLLAGAPTASAHPLGNLSVNTYDGVAVATDAVRVDHVEDIAEVPTVAALQAADADRDGDVTTPELAAWAATRCADAASRIAFEVGGRAALLAPRRRAPPRLPGRRACRRCACSATCVPTSFSPGASTSRSRSSRRPISAGAR